jgi:hypothetical protein
LTASRSVRLSEAVKRHFQHDFIIGSNPLVIRYNISE